MCQIKSLDKIIKQNKFLFKLLFPIYSLVRYPHFLIMGMLLKIRNRPITSGSLKISYPKENTSFLFVASLFFGMSEEDEKQSIDKYLNPNAVVLELGGCLGIISCYINEKLINKKNHVVLEANPSLIGYLIKNRDLNNYSFLIKNKVISNSDFIDFHIAKSIHSSSIKNKTLIKHTIEGITIKNLEKECSLNFDTLIMDIEGAELELILNTKFDELSIHTIIFELHDFNKMLNKKDVEKIEIKLKKDGFIFCDKIETSVIWKRI
jgi:FkbM family methyltransferase